MSKRISTPRKGSTKKREEVFSPSRRRALTVLGVMGLGAGLSSFGLFGRKLLKSFQNIAARPLYLEGKRMKTKGQALFWVDGWILSEQDLHLYKKK